MSFWILNWFERYPDSNKHIWNTCIGDFSNVHIVFPGGKKAVGTTTKTITQERIINLHDYSLGDIFIPSKYPTYRKERSGADGNDYMSPFGRDYLYKICYIYRKCSNSLRKFHREAYFMCCMYYSNYGLLESIYTCE